MISYNADDTGEIADTGYLEDVQNNYYQTPQNSPEELG